MCNFPWQPSDFLTEKDNTMNGFKDTEKKFSFVKQLSSFSVWHPLCIPFLFYPPGEYSLLSWVFPTNLRIYVPFNQPSFLKGPFLIVHPGITWASMQAQQ